MANRKLQTEIERVIKKVSEGTENFDEIYEKIYSSTNTNQKEKLESDLKKEIKKLQRLRDQIKTWLSSNEIKDKKVLLDNRKLIESQMERFKACEKEMKTKAYSKEGLLIASKMDAKDKERLETVTWLQDIVELLSSQVEVAEAEMETLQAGVKKKSSKDSGKLDRYSVLERKVDRHKFHIGKLELVLRMFENNDLSMEQVNGIKDSVDYYIESHEEGDFVEDENIYDELELDESLMVLDDHHNSDSDDDSTGSVEKPVAPPAKIETKVAAPPAPSNKVAASTPAPTIKSPTSPNSTTSASAAAAPPTSAKAPTQTAPAAAPTTSVASAPSAPAAAAAAAAAAAIAAAASKKSVAQPVASQAQPGPQATKAAPGKVPIVTPSPAVASRPAVVASAPVSSSSPVGLPSTATATTSATVAGQRTFSAATAASTARTAPSSTLASTTAGSNDSEAEAKEATHVSNEPPKVTTSWSTAPSILSASSSSASSALAASVTTSAINGSGMTAAQMPNVGVISSEASLASAISAASAAGQASLPGAAANSSILRQQQQQQQQQQLLQIQQQLQSLQVSQQLSAASQGSLGAGPVAGQSLPGTTAIQSAGQPSVQSASSAGLTSQSLAGLQGVISSLSQQQQQQQAFQGGVPTSLAQTAGLQAALGSNTLQQLHQLHQMQQMSLQPNTAISGTAGQQLPPGLHQTSLTTPQSAQQQQQQQPAANSSAINPALQQALQASGSLMAMQLGGQGNGLLPAGSAAFGNAVAPALPEIEPLDEDAAIAESFDLRVYPQMADLLAAFEHVKQKASRGDDLALQHQILDGSFQNKPERSDFERPKVYTPKNPANVPSYYPQVPITGLLENAAMFSHYEVDLLFYIFYYHQGSRQQYLAASELKKQSWRFHKKYLTWFQRHEEPKEITNDHEMGTYIYFDYEEGWCQRKKSEFVFEYRFLEDDRI